MNDDRHILVMEDGTEWLRDPRFDSEQRLKDMPQEMADDFRRVLPIRQESQGYNPATMHVFLELGKDAYDWDGSEDDPTSRFTYPVQVHVHHGDIDAVTNMHLHGVAVHQDEFGVQQADDPLFTEDLDLLTGISNPDHPYYTVTLENGRSYVVFAVPYC